MTSASRNLAAARKLPTSVSTPMASNFRCLVKGKQATPFYLALAKATGQSPQWNFHKYLIDRNGKVLASFASTVEPDNTKLVSAIEKAL
ncbi:MAG: hypothetical protein RLZZ371_1896 [Pseudomonadota bacterium]